MNEVKFKGMLVAKHPVQNGLVFSDEAISDIVIKQPKVPGGKYDLANVSVGEDCVRTINKLELTELAITLHPADPTLAPFTRRNIEEPLDE